MPTSETPITNTYIPQGFEMRYNEFTQQWALRPVNGYSEMYLGKDYFIPKPIHQPDLLDVSDDGYNSQFGNGRLHSAKRENNDEFYTTLPDIIKEARNYKECFKDAVVYCPCDRCFNAGMSNFARLFINKFHTLGLKKLVCTQYNPNRGGFGFKWEYSGEYPDDSEIGESDIDTFILKGNGSFDSDECRQIMKECDIVVTNPPFSLFRQFIGQIIQLGKKFLVIGNKNAITYKDIFPYIQANKLWLGCTHPDEFIIPTELDVNNKKQYIKDGIVYQKLSDMCYWYTNLPHDKRNTPIKLKSAYSQDKYPKYDNYDAIEVNKVADIPADYDGVMGVPISFLPKYNPDQFEILGLVNSGSGIELGFVKDYSSYAEIGKDGNPTGRNGKKTNGNPMLRGIPENGNYYMDAKGDCVYSTYARILVKKAEPDVNTESVSSKHVYDPHTNQNQLIPEGFELKHGSHALRPIDGFSLKYLGKDFFIPKDISNGKPMKPDLWYPESNAGNSNLGKARTRKNDEFYTTLSDIKKELERYREHFRDAVVYCPCDKCFDIGFSNFARYFISEFHTLGLKKLVCTQYNPNSELIEETTDDVFRKRGIMWEYSGEHPDGSDIGESDIDTFVLEGNGSFDSDECRRIMKECDIVVTNPPFSLFRQFTDQIMELGKKFLIIGNQNSIGCKETFGYIKSGEMWLGCTQPDRFMTTLEKVENSKRQYESEGIVYQYVGNTYWFTNLNHGKRNEKLELASNYSPEAYPKYDDYDAIEVGRVTEIPADYDGVMGVPISFLPKHNPEQFEILGLDRYMDDNPNYGYRFHIGGKEVYGRILIKRK